MSDKRYYVQHSALGYQSAIFKTLEDAIEYVTTGIGSSYNDTFYIGAVGDDGLEQPNYIYFRGYKYVLEDDSEGS